MSTIKIKWSKGGQCLSGTYGKNAKPAMLYLLNALGPVVKELQIRGYDMNTFKLEVQKREPDEQSGL